MPKNVEKSFERLLDDNAELYRFLHFCYSVLKPLGLSFYKFLVNILEGDKKVLFFTNFLRPIWDPFWTLFLWTFLTNDHISYPFSYAFGTLLGPFRDPFGTLSGPFRDPFGTLSGPFRDPFGTLWGSFRDPLGPFWDPFGTNSGSFLDHLGILLGPF